jgi:hypothetical protein
VTIDDEIPPELEALYEAERSIPPIPPDVIERALAALSTPRVIDAEQPVEPSSGAPDAPRPAAPAAPPAGGTIAGAAAPATYALRHLLIAGAIGAAAGALGYRAIDAAVDRSDERADDARPATTDPVIAAADAAIDDDGIDGGSGRPVSAPTEPAAMDTPTPDGRRGDGLAGDRRSTGTIVGNPGGTDTISADTIAAERRILDVARFAAARGDARGALAALDDHRRRFSRGELAEERQAMEIHLLLRVGDDDAARAAAARFRRTYPRSLMRQAIEDAVSTAAED